MEDEPKIGDLADALHLQRGMNVGTVSNQIALEKPHNVLRVLGSRVCVIA